MRRRPLRIALGFLDELDRCHRAGHPIVLVLADDHLAGVVGEVIGESETGKRVRFDAVQALELHDLLSEETP